MNSMIKIIHIPHFDFYSNKVKYVKPFSLKKNKINFNFGFTDLENASYVKYNINLIKPKTHIEIKKPKQINSVMSEIIGTEIKTPFYYMDNNSILMFKKSNESNDLHLKRFPIEEIDYNEFIRNCVQNENIGLAIPINLIFEDKFYLYYSGQTIFKV